MTKQVRLASLRSSKPTTTVEVARTLNDYAQVIATRSAVYLAEQDCPYEEEFDGNDLSGATHLIAYRDRELAGVMRVRWFATFAKAERAAVLKKFRGSGVAFDLMDEAIRLASHKGYAAMVGHVEAELLPFWSRRSDISVRSNRPTVSFSDRRYHEILIRVPRSKDALSIDSAGNLLNRPEGAWDTPGILDRSVARMIARAQ